MDDDLLLARRATLAGAAVGLGYFADLGRLDRERKPDGSVVTEADRAVEATIREVLAEARPDDAILGEEVGQIGSGGRRWIVDPIDGTAQFVAGDDRWLVLVALEEAGEIVVGVAAVPAQRTIWWARRGGGAYQAEISGTAVTGERLLRTVGTPAATSGTGTADLPAGLPAGSRLGVVPPDEQVYPAEREMIAALSAVTTTVPWRTHAALLVARGELDLAVQTRGQVWDFAATSLIVTEAGGRYSGFDGRSRPAAGPSLFARTPALHDAALRRLAGTVRPEPPPTGTAA
ncbi:inositol monophosphatase [Micromonospora sp. WMMD1102]|uniref:inositol monophosphatase family protein n=1 Tax=Micromonospora sp. WMMD1102 TaxID=3016105 RepID=UPI002414FE94|nr:inositol monophosphatase [Micromonospora sp. WMMD1102]MDG4787272.1 inositol monophosphatase [Micromonospora sp. WMMD1102]